EITARADVVVLDDDGRVERLLDAKYKRLDSTPSARGRLPDGHVLPPARTAARVAGVPGQ
ncbi:MAG: hypothetical protein PGN11_16050, partial [Quadrisphaera sp.]